MNGHSPEFSPVLITGISGFAGSHLAEHLLASGAEVSGLDRCREPGRNLEAVRERIRYHCVDLEDGEAVYDTLCRECPAAIFHLAAASDVARSWRHREETLRTNLFGCLNLLEAVRRLRNEERGIRIRLVVAGSGEQYGVVPAERQPIPESAPMQPRSPYAVSKCAQELLCYQYRAIDGLEIINVRPFNHIGPRQGSDFVTASFARQVAEIEAGAAPPVIRVGNLDARRDFTDVRDMVRAYGLVLEKGRSELPYNLASGVAHSIREALDSLLSLSATDIRVEADPSRLRPSDIALISGDPTRLIEHTGWRPEIPFERSLADILDYWRERTRLSQLR